MPGTGHARVDLTPTGHPGVGLEVRAQALRDLRWLLLSPPLLNTTPGHFRAEVQRFDPPDSRLIQDWLQDLERRALAGGPSPLDELVPAAAPGERHLPLGRHAEQLLKFFLQHGPTHRLMASQQVVRTPQGGTLGEIDFLVEDRHGERWHWELAVKFYLCLSVEPQVDAADFIGPDGRDRLSAKLARLFDRQLALDPPAPWGTMSWRRAAFVRGWLFHRADHPMPACGALNPAHLRGTWLTASQAAMHERTGWVWLPRARWLSPAQRREAPPAGPQPGAGQEPVSATSRAALWVHLQPAPDGGGWHETERCFVVPDDPQWRVPR